ncbi:glycosyltransferase family 4 protein [Thermoanaerobacterium thermosaccharolyticum]|uniref:glycosyltransferase family 4 protein n=1 Tax=Thermoanaerobacterium thermosaccharolyticum TaxID=1517 RepID=UPI003DA82EAA
MRILHVIDSLNIGGAETLVTNYLLHTKDIKEINNGLCVLYDDKTFLTQRLIDNNVKIYNLRLTKKYDLKAIPKLVKLINENNYDIIHVHLFPAQYFCAIASLFTKGKKYVFTEHNDYNKRRDKIIFKIIEKFTYARYTKIICISKSVKDSLLRWLPHLIDKVEIIYNGIPLLTPKNISGNYDYDIILIGSLRDKQKGVDVLLKAVKIIENEINKVAIVGDGKLKNDLINLRDKLGLRNKIEFLGFRENIDSLLEKSKIFVLPSRWEGFGLVIVEAMSKAKPIIASNVGGIPEIIKNGKTGILVEPENELELANAIEKLLNNTEYAEYLGKNAYNDAINRFSIETYVKNLRKLYMSLKM